MEEISEESPKSRRTFTDFFLGRRAAKEEALFVVSGLDSKGAKEACKSDRPRQELSNKILIPTRISYLLNFIRKKSASIQPRPIPLKFAKS